MPHHPDWSRTDRITNYQNGQKKTICLYMDLKLLHQGPSPEGRKRREGCVPSSQGQELQDNGKKVEYLALETDTIGYLWSICPKERTVLFIPEGEHFSLFSDFPI